MKHLLKAVLISLVVAAVCLGGYVACHTTPTATPQVNVSSSGPKSVETTTPPVTPKADGNESIASHQQKQSEKSNLLQLYDVFLSQLDSADITTVPIAVSKYKELFKNQSVDIKDRAFVLFYSYFDKVSETKGGFKSFYETAEKNKIIKNGFTTFDHEGIEYTTMDRGYIAEHFYSHVSKAMRGYLEKLNDKRKDFANGFKPETLVNRAIWWGNFIDSNRNFAFLEVAKENHKLYSDILLSGTDSMPVISYQGCKPKVNAYFRTAYVYLQNRFPDSKSNKSIAPYFKALIENNKTNAKQIHSDFWVPDGCES